MATIHGTRSCARRLRRLRRPVCTAWVALTLVAGCASVPDATDPPTPVEPLEIANTELPEHDVIDIHVARFEANVPSNPEIEEVEQVFTEVRRAEARYIPYTLRQTLERSGQWGDVRVVPESMPGAELTIEGTILDSHGETLTLAVQARDATGRVWLDREYSATINDARYRLSERNGTDPFQDVYNRIANDLLEVRAELQPESKREIARVADLRFAAHLAPEVYQPRLEGKENGRITAAAAGTPVPDPLDDAIDEARLRDARMIDILDQHYSDFHARMQQPYSEWREASYREMLNLRQLRRQANARKALGALAILGGIFGVVEAEGDLGQLASQAAIVGGIYAISSGIDKGRQTSIHVESLRELGRSLEQDLEPRVLDIKDKTVRLTGSAEVQYQQLREILAEMVAEQRALAEQDRAEREAARSASGSSGSPE